MRTVVRDEISRVLAPGGLVYLVGGPNAISDEIRSELDRAGYQTKRVAGANRYETAIQVARELPNTSNFVFATGRSFPDALSAGTAAAALTVGARETGEYPPFALLLTADESLRPVVADFVLDRADQLGEWTLVTAGGWAEQAVSDTFGPDAIEASFTGANRYDTAAQVANGIFTHPDGGELVGLGVGLSTGTNFPDALAATPYLAEFAQPLLLARPDDLRRPTREFLLEHAGGGGIAGQDRWIDVFGGTVAINSSTLRTAVRFF